MNGSSSIPAEGVGEDDIHSSGRGLIIVTVLQLLMEMQDFQKAEQYFRRALIKSPDPHNAIVYTQQAYVCRQALAPGCLNCEIVWVYCGFRLLEMLARENRDGCVVLLKKALDVDPDYSPALELMMDIELQA